MRVANQSTSVDVVENVIFIWYIVLECDNTHIVRVAYLVQLPFNRQLTFAA